MQHTLLSLSLLHFVSSSFWSFWSQTAFFARFQFYSHIYFYSWTSGQNSHLHFTQLPRGKWRRRRRGRGLPNGVVCMRLQFLDIVNGSEILSNECFNASVCATGQLRGRTSVCIYVSVCVCVCSCVFALQIAGYILYNLMHEMPFARFGS